MTSQATDLSVLRAVLLTKKVFVLNKQRLLVNGTKNVIFPFIFFFSKRIFSLINDYEYFFPVKYLILILFLIHCFCIVKVSPPVFGRHPDNSSLQQNRTNKNLCSLCVNLISRQNLHRHVSYQSLLSPVIFSHIVNDFSSDGSLCSPSCAID